MKSAISILLMLQILCVSLAATTHAAIANHIEHEAEHHHVYHGNEVDLNLSHSENEFNRHDPTSHTHLSLDILITRHIPQLTPFKNSWVVIHHPEYVSETSTPPIPPPTI
jgi:hypothetical protein